MTSNNYGDIVTGSVVLLPGTDTKCIVGEVYSGKTCKLYSQDTNKYIGQFTIDELEVV